jgi:hypothetical protein
MTLGMTTQPPEPWSAQPVMVMAPWWVMKLSRACTTAGDRTAKSAPKKPAAEFAAHEQVRFQMIFSLFHRPGTRLRRGGGDGSR